MVAHFNPRPREEGDGSYRDNVGAPINFNPRPREEGDGLKRRILHKRRYFNPRPREEGDLPFSSSSTLSTSISIHALVKRATDFL